MVVSKGTEILMVAMDGNGDVMVTVVLVLGS